MRVKSHLALLATAVLVPVVLFSSFVLSMLLAAEREAAFRSMHELARAAMLAVDQELTYALATANALSTSAQLAEGDFAGFYKQAAMVNRGRESNAVLLNQDGQQIFNTMVPFGTRIGLPSPESQKRIDDVLQKNAPQITNLITGSRTGRYVFGVEVPVRLKDGSRYVVNEWMYASYLSEVLPKKNVPKTWLLALYDRNGTIAARSRDPEKYVGSLPVDELHKLVLSREKDEFQLPSREGGEAYGVLARSDLSGWTVAVGVPVNEIEQAARHAVAVAAFGLLAAVTCAVVGAFVLGRRLVRAIHRVKHSAALLGQNKIPPLVDSNVGEVTELHTSLHEVGKILRATDKARAENLAEAEQARAMAESQNKAKDEFLAMLGHELRNPLAAITAGITLLNQEGISPESSRRAREIIERQGQHLSSLVDELLDAHRVMSGKVSLSIKRIRLDDAVQACVAASKTRIGSDQYVVNLTSEPAYIDADPTRLEQMVGNLLENAFKYTPEGGTIDVSVRIEQSDAVVTVADNGIGIAPEILPRIFDVFVQGEVVNRSKGGLGIGLAVVHSLATQHGANVTAESSGPGRGSMFTIRFPLAQAPVGEAIDDRKKPARASGRKALKVLVIEDNADLRTMMCAMLAMSGHQVLSAQDGETGLGYALREQPDTVLIDIDLPDISGYEVAARLRAATGRRAMRVIAVTGYAQKADLTRALSSGFDVHLKKPVGMTELLEAL